MMDLLLRGDDHIEASFVEFTRSDETEGRSPLDSIPISRFRILTMSLQIER